MKISSSRWTFTLIIVSALVIGTFIGELLSSSMPIFSRSFTVSLLNRNADAWLIDLNFMKMNLGFVFRLNLGSIIFLILSLIVFNKK
ncbi:MAG: DUF4321 domain-containing protein [Eubacteriaceae bacterium]|nr:DUF4321 domain-containing protein [Eubacteriaceae bacterium]